MREAEYYQAQDDGVVCLLCPKRCRIGEGQTGFCRVRTNRGGKLYAKNYSACTACALDPVEKKPLYHFYPGSQILSIGTWGCNFACRFCQNWQIAHGAPPVDELTPDRAAAMAASAGGGNIGLAYTYSEPGVWFEYVLDTAQDVHRRGLKNVLVTNGFINPEPLSRLLPYLDALNIDVKAFNEEFYRQMCAGRLADVKRTVELAAAAAHVEVTCLVIPGCNDAPAELAGLAEWLAGLKPDIPLHFSRYFPNYRLNLPPTPLDTLESAYATARKFLPYVYVGNAGARGVNTFCPICGRLVIDRVQGTADLAGKQCPECGAAIAIVGDVRLPAPAACP